MRDSTGNFMHGLLALLLTTLCSLLHAAPLNVVIVDPLVERIDLSDSMALLHDPQKQLVFSEVAQRLEQFVPASRSDLVTSFNPGVFWLKLSLHNDSSRTLTRWLIVGSAKTQRVTSHLFQEGRWQIAQSGRNLPLLDKPVAALEPAFPVTLMPNSQVDLLLQIDSRGATDMATSLWEPQAYHHASSRFLVREAALLGGLLVSSVLSLIVFVRLRETQYFWLGLTLFAIACLEASRENFISTFLWPAHLSMPPQTLALFAVISIFSVSMVATHALELARWMPAASRMLMILRWGAVVGVLVALFSYGHGVRIMSAVSVIQNISILGLCLLTWRRGQPGAVIFLLAFSLALLTEISRQLANLGLLPWIGAMDFSVFFFLLASPLILLGLLEQTRLLASRLQASEQLQHAKSAFFARISHELRSPLNTILGYSRMLARGSSRLNFREGMAGIEKSTLRLLCLIDELLDEARVAAGKLNIHPVPLALMPWLDEIERTTRLTCEAQGNQLDCQFSGDLPTTIRADGKRLRQVLDNLIANANRHTLQGKLILECRGEQFGNTVTLAFAVEDTGEGIETAQLATLFEPFERGNTTTQGHGLGLSICRELVRLMGGDIVVTSKPGQGSRFAFSLGVPIIEAPTFAAPQERVSAPTSLNHPSILLVDDDAIQLGLLAELCHEAGFVVSIAAGGREAALQIQAQPWDIILTDQMMPDVDGWGVLSAARTLLPGTPVVLLSAAEPMPSAKVGPDMHFDATLLKPASPEDILAILWRQLIKVGVGKRVLDWAEVARLASEGDVSAIEDWIADTRINFSDCGQAMLWVEGLLDRLELSLLERVATALSSSPSAN